MMRVLVPARLRKAVRRWFDSRYISVADHRRDIKDALWEVQTLRREMTALRGEVTALRAQVERLGQAVPPGGSRLDVHKLDDTHRLAQETARALDGLLQNEVLLWQAVDDLKARVAAPTTGPGGHRNGHGAGHGAGHKAARAGERP